MVQRFTGADLALRVVMAVLLIVPGLLLARTSTRLPALLTAPVGLLLLADPGVVGWAQVASLCAAAGAWLREIPPAEKQLLR